MDFTNKTVLITGASRGIGRETAVQFAKRGAKVAVHFNSNRQAAEETIGLLAGDGHCIVQGNIGEPEAVKRFVDDAVSVLGRIDILVNNAAIYEDHPLAEVDYETWQAQWEKIIGINLLGSANVSYCAGRHMIEQGYGRIVNISSRGAFRGEPTSPAYGASKAALNAMSQSLAKHLAPHNVFVAVVAPGFVETDMAQEILDSPRGEFLKNESPLKRVAKPEEVAYTAVFLASEGAEFMTGCVVDVNGASYLRT
ncbi:MAG: SDR family NAD(P)-dependent oxidoreductase [Chloroflexota bacterium]